MAQTYTNWEAILVDDGSTDKSGAICDEYAERDRRFVIVHKQNEGVAKARITAFEHSKGDLITFIDADDYVSNDYLEELSKPILEKDADMVSCNYFIVKENTIVEPRLKLTGVYKSHQIKDFIANHYCYDKSCRGYGMTIFLWTKMIKREYTLDALQQGLGLWLGEDQIGVFSTLYKIKKLYLLPNRLYYYVQHTTQATKLYKESLWDNIIILLERYKKIDVECLTYEGLHKLTWLHISRTVGKMFKSGVSRQIFVSHLSKMRSTAYMRDFFSRSKVSFGVKQTFIFWLLKLRLFNLYYWFKTIKVKLSMKLHSLIFLGFMLLFSISACGEIEDDTFHSSFICTYEKYMDLEPDGNRSAQATACYGDYLVQGYNYNGYITVYDLKGKKKLSKIIIPAPTPSSRTHVNTMNFGNQRFHEDDYFPLLYISSGYPTDGLYYLFGRSWFSKSRESTR